MEAPPLFFRFFGPLAIEPIMNMTTTLYPNEDIYIGTTKSQGAISLYPIRGNRPVDFNLIRTNIRKIRQALNSLQVTNFRIFSRNPISAARFKGANGTLLVTQDEVTTAPNHDGLASKNLIPRITETGFLPMPNRDFADSGDSQLGNSDTFVTTFKDRGQLAWVPDGTVRAWVTRSGWTETDPGATVAASFGFAIDFNPNKTIWIMFVDNDPVAFVNGNNQTDNFVNVEPGDSDTEATTKAFIDFDTTNNRIEFFTQTVKETVVKRVGFIDSTGLNNG